MKLTKKKAKELCIKKWEYIVNNDGILDGERLRFAIPEIKDLSAECAYCELYLYTVSAKIYYCFECPLRPKYSKDYDEYDYGCLQQNHPFNIWWDNKTKENAQKVLDLIKNS